MAQVEQRAFGMISGTSSKLWMGGGEVVYTERVRIHGSFGWSVGMKRFTNGDQERDHREGDDERAGGGDRVHHGPVGVAVGCDAPWHAVRREGASGRR